MAGANFAYAATTAQYTHKTTDPNQYEEIEPLGILSASIQLDRRNATTLSFRAIAIGTGINRSMSTTVALQQLENGRWVNRGTPITRTANNVFELDVFELIDVRAHGSGSFRVRATFSAVTNGITTTVGPLYSFSVNM
jgi:hypothetical protein